MWKPYILAIIATAIIVFNVMLYFYFPTKNWPTQEYTEYQTQNEIHEIWESRYDVYFDKISRAERFLSSNIDESKYHEYDSALTMLKISYISQDQNLELKDRVQKSVQHVFSYEKEHTNIIYVTCKNSSLGFGEAICAFQEYLKPFNDIDYLVDAFQGKHIKNFLEKLGPEPPKPPAPRYVANPPLWYRIFTYIFNLIWAAPLSIYIFLKRRKNKKDTFLAKEDKSFSPYRKQICPKCGEQFN